MGSPSTHLWSYHLDTIDGSWDNYLDSLFVWLFYIIYSVTICELITGKYVAVNHRGTFDEAISVFRSLFGAIRTETVKEREEGVGGNQREKKQLKDRDLSGGAEQSFSQPLNSHSWAVGREHWALCVYGGDVYWVMLSLPHWYNGLIDSRQWARATGLHTEPHC